MQRVLSTYVGSREEGMLYQIRIVQRSSRVQTALGCMSKHDSSKSCDCNFKQITYRNCTKADSYAGHFLLMSKVKRRECRNESKLHRGRVVRCWLKAACRSMIGQNHAIVVSSGSFIGS